MAQTQAPEKGNIVHGLYVQTVRFSIPNLWGQGQTSRASHGVGKGLSMSARSGGLISRLAPTALTASSTASPLGGLHTQSHFQDGKEPGTFTMPRQGLSTSGTLAVTAGPSLQHLVFLSLTGSIPALGDLAAQDNEPNGISWLAEEERAHGVGECGPPYPASVTSLSWVLS